MTIRNRAAMPGLADQVGVAVADGCQPGAQISGLWPRGSVAGITLPGLGDDGLEEGRLGGELFEQGGLRDPGRFGDPGQ